MSSLKFLATACCAVAAMAADQPPSCAATSPCQEVPSFTAQITDFRTSVNGRSKVITTTIRFTNRLNRPLILGYVEGSGVATDDQGNRYVLYGDNAIRAMGIISRNGLDPKFELAPGQWADARYELFWNPSSRDIYGLRFDLDLTVRELNPIQGRQYRLGLEHALRFRNLGGAIAPPAPTPAPTATSAATAAPSPQDLCANRPRCAHPGPFLVEIRSLTSALSGPYLDHVVRLHVEFRNTGTQPLILGYTAKTSKMIDDLGNEYYWGSANTYDKSVTGMGTIESRSANADFVLDPGQARTATFQLARPSTIRKQLGTRFSWDFAVQELAVLPSRQVTAGRQYSLNFQDLEIRPPTQANAPANSPQRQQTPAESLQQLKDIFKKKQK